MAETPKQLTVLANEARIVVKTPHLIKFILYLVDHEELFTKTDWKMLVSFGLNQIKTSLTTEDVIKM